VAHLEHVLERERLEVQPVGGVVVGRHGLGVAVDHDGLVAGVAQREHGVDAAVVELDALADAVGPAAEDDDLSAIGDLGLVGELAGKGRLVGRIHIGRGRGEFGRAGVDALVDGVDVEAGTEFCHLLGGGAGERAEAGIRKTERLEHAQILGVGRQAVGADAGLGGNDRLDLLQEPRVDAAHGMHVFQRGAHADRLRDHAQPVGGGGAEGGADGVLVVALAEAGDLDETLPD
jgi:hypothetical protein